MSFNPLLAVVGPTASGKTKFAIELAKRFQSEIVCADSMQIYKELSVSTAKPTPEECAQAKHHMFDIISVKSSYSVAQYSSDAKKVIADIQSRNRLPILTGGTGLYIDSVIENVQFTKEESDPFLRKQLQAELAGFGGEYMLKKLAEIDPQTALTLHPNNTKRIIRALEIYLTTGKPMSEHVAESKTVPSPYNTLIFGLTYKDRDILYDRINQRVDKMVDEGIVEEARRLFDGECGQTASGAIGCKEFLPYLSGKATLSECIENLKQQTRRYAKRQLTWFRKNTAIHWFYLDEQTVEDALADAQIMIKEFLEGGKRNV